MSTIVLRSVKGSPLTNTEVDTNFSNLNTDKVEKTAAAITGGTINGTSVGATTASTGAFTTLGATGNVTLGDADTDTITQAASYVTGTQLKSAKTATNTLSLAAYDVDGTAYTNLITLTASNTPTLALTSTGVGTINNMSIGATTASTGAFTTLSTTGNITNSNSAGRLDFTGASSAQVWATASSLYLDAATGQSVIIRPNNQVTAGTFSSTGLAIAPGVLTLGTDLVYDAFINSPESMFFNVDSDANSSNQSFIFGTDRAGTTGGTEFMRISGAAGGVGAVGIGYSSLTSVGNNGLAVLGNVGIGTSSPAYKLDVSGYIRGVVSNASVGNASSAQFVQNSTGDAAISFLIGATTEWLAGVDNSDSDSFKINAITGGSDFTGTGITLTTAGNLGLGVTPSAWTSGRNAIQLFGSSTAVYFAGATTNTIFSNNNYYNAGDKFTTASGYAQQYQQQSNGVHAWFTSTAASGGAGATATFTQAMTLDASGNLGVGTTSPSSRLEIIGVNPKLTINANDSVNGRNATLSLISGTSADPNSTCQIMYGASNQTTSGTLTFIEGDGTTERARITPDGNLLVGKTASSFGTVGHEFFAVGAVYHTRNADPVLFINRLTNDGNLVEFYQDGTLEGAISVSGTTVTYGGGHLARFGQLPDGSEDPTLLKGTVLTNLNEMCVWINKETGIPADNEQCNKVKISDVDGDANVAGVFVSWAYDEQHDTNDLYVAMTGDMIIRIAQGITVARGDLLMSAGDGTAKPQGDDIVRSKTVAKVTSTHVTCTYADGSYCVPCVLMAC